MASGCENALVCAPKAYMYLCLQIISACVRRCITPENIAIAFYENICYKREARAAVFAPKMKNRKYHSAQVDFFVIICYNKYELSWTALFAVRNMSV